MSLLSYRPNAEHIALQGDEWEEKWGEQYWNLGRANKFADKWGREGTNVWHERWGEDYDGSGGCFKYTDKVTPLTIHCTGLSIPLLGKYRIALESGPSKADFESLTIGVNQEAQRTGTQFSVEVLVGSCFDQNTVTSKNFPVMACPMVGMRNPSRLT